MDQLTFLSEEPLVSHSASPASERAWMTRAATSRSSFSRWLIDSNLAGFYGKTSPESFPLGRMSRKVLRPSNPVSFSEWAESIPQDSLPEPLSKWSSPTILTASSGGWQNSGMGVPGAFSTQSIAEYPSVGVASLLWDILEEPGSVPQRYFLTAAACRGILRRAERRGKKLPERLTVALQAVAEAQGQEPMGHAVDTCSLSSEELGGTEET